MARMAWQQQALMPTQTQRMQAQDMLVQAMVPMSAVVPMRAAPTMLADK